MGIMSGPENSSAQLSTVIYARVSEDIKTRVEEYARRQSLTLARAIADLLTAGLDAGTEQRLTSWAATYASRDLLIRQALADGVSKHRIHVLTGIARTTINRVSREA